MAFHALGFAPKAILFLMAVEDFSDQEAAIITRMTVHDVRKALREALDQLGALPLGFVAVRACLPVNVAVPPTVSLFVMPGLVPGTHAPGAFREVPSPWVPGTSPGMTNWKSESNPSASKVKQVLKQDGSA